MSITPGLPETDNFQHWTPWRALGAETARRVLSYTGARASRRTPSLALPPFVSGTSVRAG
jgi:hypothetical protein